MRLLETTLLSFFVVPCLGQHSADLIYGNDDRIEVSALANQCQMEQSSAVGGQVWNWQFIPGENPADLIDFVPESLSSLFNFCPDEAFIEQPTLPRCTGFHLGNNLLLTAGHCLISYNSNYTNPEEVCAATSWVFTYEKDKESFQQNEIHPCEEVLAYSDGVYQDYALLKLGGSKIQNQVQLSDEGIKLNENVYSIGHGSFLPKKFYGGARATNVLPSTFVTNLDTFMGNSGSPVFSEKTNKVVGMLISGSDDYYFDDDSLCMRSIRKSDSADEAGEIVLKITEVIDLIQTNL